MCSIDLLGNMSVFDEDNDAVMGPLGASMGIVAAEVFPATVTLKGQNFELHCASTETLRDLEIARFIELIDECMGQFYVRHKGEDWKMEKVDEMTETGLVYTWYESHGVIAGLMSFKLVTESYGQVLYLYEIQISPKFQGEKLGSKFVSGLHVMSTVLNTRTKDLQLPMSTHFSNIGTGLTVFSDNSRALDWYHRLGYSPSEGSPTDKRLRNGKVVKPSYYLLFRASK